MTGSDHEVFHELTLAYVSEAVQSSMFNVRARKTLNSRNPEQRVSDADFEQERTEITEII